MREEMATLKDLLREKEATLIVLGDDERFRHPTDAWIPVPKGLPEWLTPLVAVVPGQLLAYHLTLARGGDPDQPRTIAKVTQTR